MKLTHPLRPSGLGSLSFIVTVIGMAHPPCRKEAAYGYTANRPCRYGDQHPPHAQGTGHQCCRDQRIADDRQAGGLPLGVRQVPPAAGKLSGTGPDVPHHNRRHLNRKGRDDFVSPFAFTVFSNVLPFFTGRVSLKVPAVSIRQHAPFCPSVLRHPL